MCLYGTQYAEEDVTKLSMCLHPISFSKCLTLDCEKNKPATIIYD